MPVIKTLKNGQWTPVNSVTSLGTATPSTAGLMSASDKAKLDNLINWKEIDTVVGTNPVTLPAEFNEIYCLCRPSATESFYRTTIIPANTLTSTAKLFYFGDYKNGTSGSSYVVQATKTSVQILYIFDNGTDITNNSRMTVYYR